MATADAILFAFRFIAASATRQAAMPRHDAADTPMLRQLRYA